MSHEDSRSSLLSPSRGGSSPRSRSRPGANLKRPRSSPTASGPPTPGKGANVGWFLLGDGVVAVDSGANDATAAARSWSRSPKTTGGKPVGTSSSRTRTRTTAGGARGLRGRRRAGHLPGGGGRPDPRFVTQAASDPRSACGQGQPRAGRRAVSERSHPRRTDSHNVADLLPRARPHEGRPRRLPAGRQDPLLGRPRAQRRPAVHAVAGRGSRRLGARFCRGSRRVPVEKLVPGPRRRSARRTGSPTSLAYVRRVNELAKKIVDGGTARRR